MEFGFAALTGLAAFISPCVLPMLPVFVSYFTAGESNWRRTLINVLGFVLGMVVVLVTIGAGLLAAGFFLGSKLTIQYRWIVQLITGLIVILMGLAFTEVIRIPFLNNTTNIKVKTSGMKFFSAIIFGLVCGLSFGPCVVTLQSFSLAQSINDAIASGNMLKGIMLQFTFAATMGSLFVICAMLIDALKGVFSFIKRHYRIITTVSGAVLIVLGILMATQVI